MSAVEAPLGHGARIAGLWQARARGRLPHALLFEGPRGIGKFLSARWFVQGLYCEASGDPGWSGPCGTCGPCKRVAAETHPDVFVLDPLREELEIIPVSAVAQRDNGSSTLTGFFALRPMEGGLRTVIVREFERAQVSAQNALLKTLEEPGSGALLILETSRPDLLLETIRSRCCSVRFERLSHENCAQILGPVAGGDESLVRWSEGSPGRAMALVAQGAVAQRAIIEALLRGQLDPFAACSALLEATGTFEGKTPSAKQRARTRAAIELMLEILSDGVRFAEGLAVEGLAHGDLAVLVGHNRLRWTQALEQLVVLRAEVELNLSPEGLLDRCLLVLADLAVSTPMQHA